MSLASIVSHLHRLSRGHRPALDNDGRRAKGSSGTGSPLAASWSAMCGSRTKNPDPQPEVDQDAASWPGRSWSPVLAADAVADGHGRMDPVRPPRQRPVDPQVVAGRVEETNRTSPRTARNVSMRGHAAARTWSSSASRSSTLEDELDSGRRPPLVAIARVGRAAAPDPHASRAKARTARARPAGR